MKWKSRANDKRNQLYGFIKYQIVCSLPWFFEARDWCWEQWGSGIEYEHFHNHILHTGQVKIWAWDCNKYQGTTLHNGKLYLPDDDALTLFRLRWPK